MIIAVAGIGYVGMSMAVLLARHNTVYAVDVIPEKVDMINHRQSPIQDKEISEYLNTEDLSLTATLDGESVYQKADFVIVCTPTDYDPDKNYFNTSSVESVIDQVHKVNPQACIVVKSTVPIGFTKCMQDRFESDRILFSPEFLREGRALYDNLYPSRIIVGVETENEDVQKQAKTFASLLRQGAEKENVEVLFMPPTEAEAVKLFANTYLAMRVAYFNELDTFAEVMNLDTSSIIRGVCLDPRIGDQYNNPSFGYGGYCFPKDTKQLLATYASSVPNRIICAVVESNAVRKRHIADQILKKLSEKNGSTVGVYRLIMKSGSDNFRQSAIQDILTMLKEQNVNIVVYEPSLETENFADCRVIRNISQFASMCDLILANRKTDELKPYKEKVYTRDVFSVD